MPDEQSAKNAIQSLNGIEIEGRKIIVNVSLPKSDVITIKKYEKSNNEKNKDFSKHTKPAKKLPPWQRKEY